MELVINGRRQNFMPIQQFRSQWHLPDEFGVAYFEPKDWQGLGSIKGAGGAMSAMRKAVLADMPETVRWANLLSVVDLLTQTFRYQLEQANTHIGLRLHDVGNNQARRHPWGGGSRRKVMSPGSRNSI